MLQEYQRQLDQATKKKQENRKFLDKLREIRPKDLDHLCNALHDEAFEQIDCLQCANCCKTTGPLLLDKDINRLAKAEGKSPGEFTQKHLRIDEDGDYVFQKMPCPYLGSDNYCSMYGDRPNACREFPHTQQRNVLQKLQITYLNTMICPAVAMVVEGLRKHYNKKTH